MGKPDTGWFDCRRWRQTGLFVLAMRALALGGLLHALPASAVEFGDGEFRGSLDTTISHGMTFRVEDRDGELADDTNGNDGNLNYDRGIVSNASKFTTELDVGFGDFGAFVRTTGFIDFENQDGGRVRTALSDAAKERVGSNVELLDAYVIGGFDVSGMALDVRLGRHVLNWGESTFIPNGINAINPFDVSKLRLPGSELREALLPVGMASASVAPTETLTLEGFYQFDWEETHIDPVGSYFSSTDYVGPGAERAVITDVFEGLRPGEPQLWDRGFGFGELTPLINAGLRAATLQSQAAFDPNFLSVRRGAHRTPGDRGQWGAALRFLAEDLNQTEFGFYFINYHSRLPTVGAQTASRQDLQAGIAAAGAVGGPTSPIAAEIAAAVTPAVARKVQAEAQAGSIPPEAVPGEIRRRVGEQVGGIASALAIDRYGKGGHYFLEYPEDIRLFGLSFNTVLGASGWALQGEYSLRPNAPLQRAERKVIEDGLAPVLRALDATREDYVAPQDLPAYFTNYRPTKVQGYVEREVSQIQATATRVFGPMLGADSLAFVAEAALMHVHDMPDKDTEPLESPAGGVLADDGEADADATSWGYRFVAQLGYSNAIDAVNLRPYAQFLHDVSGNSPAPSGPFVEGRTTLTIGLRADYLSSWQADLNYTRLAGEGNELADRDFVSLSVKYSF